MPGAGATADDKKPEKIDPAKLVGGWRPKDPETGVNAVAEYRADGTMAHTITVGTEASRVEGTYRLTGSRLALAARVRGEDCPFEWTVSTLTDTTLTLTDRTGRKSEFLRISAK